MEQAEYHIIIDKLDKFIRRYYINSMIRGVLYFLGFTLVLILFLDLSEFVFRFSTLTRKFLFFGALLALLTLFIIYILNPFLKYFKLGKRIDYQQASDIIGNHFPLVQDKLLNTLQLHEMALNQQQTDLLLAGIKQKSLELKPIPFQVAIDFKKNRKYLKYVLIPLFVAGLILLIAPAIITGSSERIFKYSEEFIPPAPFAFILQNSSLEVPENQDLNLEITLSGELIPSVVYLVNNGNKLSLVRKGPREFSYHFKNLKQSFDFKLQGDQYFSKTYEVSVVPNPTISNFKINLKYPDYLGLKNKTLENQGDINIPEGTKIAWEIRASSADEVKMSFEDTLVNLDQTNPGQYNYALQASSSQAYEILVLNHFKLGNDTLKYKMQIKPDLFPSISVNSIKDSVSNQLVYFNGKIEDDYGFSRLRFYYRVKSKDNTSSWVPVIVSIPKGVNQTRYFYSWNLSNLKLNAGDNIEYYFQITDNDGLHGGKSTKTELQLLSLPTLEELKTEEDDTNTEIKEKLSKSIDEAKRLRKEFERLQMELLQKQEMSWQDQKQLENLLDKQQNLQQDIRDIQKKNLLNQQKSSEFNKQSEEILKKQEEINKLFDELMTDEMKQLYEDIQKLIEELNKDQLQEKMGEMEMSNEDLEKELDRTLELFKQLELEKKITDTADELKKLSEKQEKLAKETQNKELSQEDLSNKQEEVKKEFDEIKKDLDEIDDKNEELEKPISLDENNKEKQEEIDKELDDSKENIEKKKNKKAAENQKESAKKMEEMADKMMSMMQQAQQQGLEEDMDALRKLLNNIIDLSINQESLMNQVNATDAKDPRFKELSQNQREQIDDSKHIADSLYALSKRIIQLETYVNREMGAVSSSMSDAMIEMADRKGKKAAFHQKFAMTSLNNLALLLDEALQQMQQQMASNMPGQGNCQKPGGGGQKPSASDIKKMQEALSKQMEKLKKEMEKGKNPGGKDGKGNKGKSGMSKEIAQMAAQQAAIRQKIEELSKELNGDGTGSGNELKKIAKEMEENEKDLANQNITRQTMMRQQDIMSRLLKAEKAEREREWDDKRKSKEVKNQKISNPEQFSKYKELKRNEAELLETLPPDLNPYYKKKVSEYFNKLETKNNG